MGRGPGFPAPARRPGSPDDCRRLAAAAAPHRVPCQAAGLVRPRRDRRVRGRRRPAGLPAARVQPDLQRGKRLRTRPVVLGDGPELPAALRPVPGHRHRPVPGRPSRRAHPRRPGPARHVGGLLRPAGVLRRRPRGHAPDRQRRRPPDPGLHRVHLHRDRRHPDIRRPYARPGLAPRRARPARHLGGRRRRLPAARRRPQAPPPARRPVRAHLPRAGTPVDRRRRHRRRRADPAGPRRPRTRRGRPRLLILCSSYSRAGRCSRRKAASRGGSGRWTRPDGRRPPLRRSARSWR